MLSGIGLALLSNYGARFGIELACIVLLLVSGIRTSNCVEFLVRRYSQASLLLQAFCVSGIGSLLKRSVF